MGERGYSMNVGVIGNGFVGNAVAKGFGKHLDVLIYDTDASRSTHTLTETLDCDYVFVCLPTPMISAEGGRCNLSILEKFFEEVSEVETEAIFIIKSRIRVREVFC
jgi:UDP-glucose 6-dehydrogenase